MNNFFKAVFASVIFITSTVTNAEVLNFDAQPEQYFVNSVVEGNYLLEGTYDGFGTNNEGLWPSNGSMHLMSWTNIGDTSGFTLSNLSNDLFNIQSFDFASGYVGGSQPVDILNVTSYLGGNLVNSVSFLSGIDYLNYSSLTTLNLGFTGIDTVRFEALGSSNRAIFDNVSVSAVPEPSTYVLMLAGLGLVGFMARRRKQA